MAGIYVNGWYMIVTLLFIKAFRHLTTTCCTLFKLGLSLQQDEDIHNQILMYIGDIKWLQSNDQMFKMHGITNVFFLADIQYCYHILNTRRQYTFSYTTHTRRLPLIGGLVAIMDGLIGLG